MTSLDVALLYLLAAVLAVVLFPLGVGPAPEILARIGVGVIWVTALLACLLSLDRLFRDDAGDGGLDLIVGAPAPLEVIEVLTPARDASGKFLGLDWEAVIYDAEGFVLASGIVNTVTFPAEVSMI